MATRLFAERLLFYGRAASQIYTLSLHDALPIYVERVAGHAVAGDLAVDRRAARESMLALLDDQHARAFAHDEAVALRVPRTRRALRLVVPRRERTHRREAADRERGDHCLAAAGEHHVCFIALNDLVRVADRMRTRRARGRGRGARPL